MVAGLTKSPFTYIYYTALIFVRFYFFLFLQKHKRLEAGYEPATRPTRHTGDVPAPIPHAVKVNPHGVKTNKAIQAPGCDTYRHQAVIHTK